MGFGTPIENFSGLGTPSVMQLFFPCMFLSVNCAELCAVMSPTSSLVVSTAEYVGKVVLSRYVRPQNGLSVCMGRGHLTMDKPLDIDPLGSFGLGIA